MNWTDDNDNFDEEPDRIDTFKQAERYLDRIKRMSEKEDGTCRADMDVVAEFGNAAKKLGVLSSRTQLGVPFFNDRAAFSTTILSLHGL